MKRSRPMPELIAADVELVEGELVKLAAVNALMSRDYEAWRKQRGPAEDATIAKLEVAGAFFGGSGDTTRFRFRGLAASSTCGLFGAFQNWLHGARRVIAERQP